MLDGCLENKKQWLILAENDKFVAWNDEDAKDDESL